MTLHVLGLVNDVTEDALLIYDVGDATGDTAFLVESAQGLGALMSREAADRLKRDSAVLREGLLSRRHVYADTPYLGVELLEFLIILLEFLQLALSTACEGRNVEGDDKVSLAFEIGHINRLAVRRPEADIRGWLSNLGHCHSGDSSLSSNSSCAE